MYSLILLYFIYQMSFVLYAGNKKSMNMNSKNRFNDMKYFERG